MRHEEDALQTAVMRYLDLQGPRYGFTALHVPNGGKRNPREGARLKAMGVKAGVPDILILKDGRADWIELKAGDGRISPAQRERHCELVERGCRIIVCRSLGEVIVALHAWGITQ